MEYIIEFILELIIEGSIELSQSKKVPKIIRYFLISIIVLFFLIVTLGLIIGGILILNKNLLIGIFIIGIGIFLFIASLYKFRKMYLIKSNSSEYVIK